jgi:hypothetical protein
VAYLPENDRVRYTISPDARKEVLKRLLKLNHEIHEQEKRRQIVKNKHEKEKTKKETKVRHAKTNKPLLKMLEDRWFNYDRFAIKSFPKY